MIRKNKSQRPWQEVLWGLLYPKRCLFCYEILDDVDWEAGICADCAGALPLVQEPTCKKCGKELVDAGAEYCSDCREHTHLFERGYALFNYTEEVQSAIVRYKYKNQRAYAKWFGQQIVERFGREIRALHAAALVPVPLYIRKKRVRGFNQAELLARAIGREIGLPVAELLVRRRSTAAQKELGYAQRLANLEGSFEVAPEVSALPEAVILVDDIYTTGSTIDACAAVLKKAGVKRVYYLVIAIGMC